MPTPARAMRRLLRGRPADPAWARPALIAVAAIAAIVMTWSLTRSGYANTYYASAVYAGSHSWSAFWHDALDSSQFVAVDKTPLAIWMMALSARILGFSSFSMLLPNALCGVASVVVLADLVRRTLGHRVAILAALLLALTPAVVLVSRFNNPDALLMLLLVCSAWATVRALESGATRHVLLAGVLVGLAFNTKMLQAYLVVPALALTLLLAGAGTLRRRVAQLLGAGVVMVAVSGAWVGAMMLTPASSRPFVGDTTSNSWWDLIFNANGLDRTGSAGGGPGGGPGGGFGGANGVLRLFNDQVGGQIAWLIPLAAVGLLAGLWAARRSAARDDRARAVHVLWGTWAVVHVAVFSLVLNLFHPYYTSALAPALAVLAASALVRLWRAASRSRATALLLAASLGATGALSVRLLDRTPSFVPWLRWVVLGLAAAAVLAVVLAPLRRRLEGRLAVLGIVAGLGAILAGPTAYAIATIGQPLGGGNPLAGPSTVGAVLGGGPGLPFGRARGGVPRPPAAALFGPSPAPPASGRGPAVAGVPPLGGPGLAGFRAPGRGGFQGQSANRQLVSYLERNRGGAEYLVAAEGSMTAAPIILATHQPVVTIGGFGGSDPSPTLPQLQGLVKRGQLRYVLLGGMGGFGGPPGAGIAGAPGGGPPPGGAPLRRGGPGAHDSAAATARTRWIQSSCKVVSLGSVSGLYDCSRGAT